MIEQIMIAVLGVTAVFLSQCENIEFRKWAGIVGLLGQPFWFIAAYKADQWGIFALCFLYTFAWAKGVYVHWFKGADK